MIGVMGVKGISGTTGRWLARQLGVNYLSHPPREHYSVIVRWGNISWLSDVDIIIQPRDAIRNAGDKLRALQIMQRAGVRVPPFAPLPCRNVDEYLPGLARTRYHHGGKGLKYCEVAQDVPSDFTYIIKYIDKVAEYRVHYGLWRDVELLYVQRKLRMADSPPATVWNYKHGYRFHTRKNPPANVVEQGRAAIMALGLTFGAADVLLDREGMAWVAEVNTAPGLKSASSMPGELSPSQAHYIKFFTEVLRRCHHV